MPWAEISLWGMLPFIIVGFTAQMIASALGMAFGVIGTALLLLLGLPTAPASAAIHAAESFTSGVSVLRHALQRNAYWRLFRRLFAPGIVGGLAGMFTLAMLNAIERE